MHKTAANNAATLAAARSANNALPRMPQNRNRIPTSPNLRGTDRGAQFAAKFHRIALQKFAEKQRTINLNLLPAASLTSQIRAHNPMQA